MSRYVIPLQVDSERGITTTTDNNKGLKKKGKAFVYVT